MGQFHDLGGFVALAMRRPLYWWVNRKPVPGERKWTAEEIRRFARAYPDDGLDLAASNMVRTVAWMMVMIVGLAVTAFTGAVRGLLGDLPMGVAIAVTMFCGGSALVSSAKWSLAWALSKTLDRRLEGTPRAILPGGCVIWMVKPSHLDTVFALLWSFVITLGILDPA